MTVDQMPANSLAKAQRVLHVHELAGGALTKCAARERLRYNVEHDVLAVYGRCGQADAVDRDRVFGLRSLSFARLRSAR